MEKLNSSLPAIISLAILAATMWYPRYRMMKHAVNEAERDTWRKRHASMWMIVSLIYGFGCVLAWQTIIFYTPLILMFDHFSQAAWLGACCSGILFYLMRQKSLIRLDWDSKKDTSKEFELEWIKRLQAFVNAKMVRILFGILYSIGMAALAIKLQSVWMIYFAQILVIPAFFLLVFGTPLLFMLFLWIHTTISEWHNDDRARRRSFP